jgi:hypothetical protein
VWLPPRRISVDHEGAHGAEQDQVGEADGEVELAERAQDREQPDPRAGADEPTGKQHQRQCRIERAPPPIGQRAGERRRRDMARNARHRDRGSDADEDQERGHQKAAADAEHAGDESDREPHDQDQEHIDGYFGDREVDLHGRCPPVRASATDSSSRTTYSEVV